MTDTYHISQAAYLGTQAARATRRGETQTYYNEQLRRVLKYVAADDRPAVRNAYADAYKAEAESYDTPRAYSGNGTW